MRLLFATCSVDYEGRLTAHLPLAPRLLMVKADGSVSIHADDRAYKPLNWMSSPCRLTEEEGRWVCANEKGERLVITITERHHEVAFDLGIEPGLQKDGVEAHLQVLLAANPEEIEAGLVCRRREYATSIGPVDLLCRAHDGTTVLVEIKRRVNIDAVEQLSRYLEVVNDPLLGTVRGVLAGQHVAPQAKTLAEQRGMRCVTVDYDRLRGLGRNEMTLF
jgi:RecB family endonuclease NucS